MMDIHFYTGVLAGSVLVLVVAKGWTVAGGNCLHSVSYPLRVLR